MQLLIESGGGIPYVATCTPGPVLRQTADILELLSFASEHHISTILLKESDFDPAFYDLRSGFAGEVVQKFVNYAIRAAIVGSLESVKSNSFRAFITEANRGSGLRFFENKADALQWLTRK